VTVPNELRPNAKILVVGEAPGDIETEQGRPFVGPAGDRLWSTFSRFGVKRENVSIANLYNEQPPNNDFTWIEENRGAELAANVRDLRLHVVQHAYNIVIVLGAKPAYYLLSVGPVGAWRGSVFSNSVRPPGQAAQKFAVTFHPAAVLRDATKLPIFDVDIEKFVKESAYPEHIVLNRTYHTKPTHLQAVEWFDKLSKAKLLAVDIEASKKTHKIICVGFADSPHDGYCFSWDDIASQTYIRWLLESNIPKVLHYGYFDELILEQEGININNYVHDTYNLQQVLWPGFPKSLAYLTSIYTDLSYYKKTGRDEIPDDEKEWGDKVDKDTLYVYNCKDCVATFECLEKMLPELIELGVADIYRQEMEMCDVLFAIARNGMPVDVGLRSNMLQSALHKWDALQMVLNSIVGQEVNVKSPKLPYILNDKLDIPYRKNRGKTTANEDAIVNLLGWVAGKMADSKGAETKARYKIKLEVLTMILEIRALRQLISNYLKTAISPDNRIRSVYAYGPETGRLKAEGFVDGTGINSQTFPRGSVTLLDAEAKDSKWVEAMFIKFAEENDGATKD
jgi:DNA polymerase